LIYRLNKTKHYRWSKQ